MQKITIFTVILLQILALKLNAQVWMQNIPEDKQGNFYEVQKEFNNYWDGKEYKKGNGWKQFKRFEYFWAPRVFPDGQMPDGVELYKRLNNFNISKNPTFQAQEYPWEPVGPINVPENRLSYDAYGIGRINCLAIHPENRDELWIGSSNGGAWYTKDGGQTWNTIDMTGVMSTGISDIAISKSEPNVIYLATGDVNGTSMTRGYSVGILKSTDGGITWNQTAYSKTKNQGAIVSRILINPGNSNVVVAGTNNGIITSVDGGATWFDSYSSGYIKDMEMHPTNSSIIYAATAGSGCAILRSLDGGSTFEQIYTLTSSNRVELSVSRAEPDYLYALASSRTTNGFLGFFKSMDKGNNWLQMSTSPNILGIDENGGSDGGQGHYDLALAVSHLDENLIYTGGVHIWKSTNSGSKWSLVNHWTGSGRPFVHADQHWLQFDYKNNRLYSCNDGGVYVSTDNGASWTDLSNGLPITQFYKISVYAGYEELVMGGTQDNGTFLKSDDKWYTVNGGDGMECKIHPDNPDIMFATTYYGNLNLSTNGGNSFSYVLGPYNVQEYGGWVTPYELDPEHPNIMYIGYTNLWKVDFDNGDLEKLSNISNNVTVGAIDVSEVNSDYIYFAKNNILYKTSNGGNSWKNIYNAQRSITGIEVSADDPNTVWITLSGYTNGAKVYEIIGEDGQNISEDLPNFPVNTIVEQKNSPGTLYVGTDIGIFKRNAFDEKWEILDNNIPTVVVNELEINYPRGYLYAGTFSRGIWKTKIINCDLEKPEITFAGETEFCQGDSLIIRKSGNYDDFIWSTGSTEDSIIVKNSGIYYLMVKDDSGCSTISDKISVNVTPVPYLSVNVPNKGRLCAGDSLTLDASFGFSKYEWSTGDTTRRITIGNDGDYWVKAYTSEGCERYFDEVNIISVAKPVKPEITRSGDTLYTDDAYAHRWFKDSTFIVGNNKEFLFVTEPGNYYAEVLNENGCSEFSDEVKVQSVDVAEKLNEGEIFVGPNPTSGFFTVRLDKNIKSEIVINNQLGQTIYRINSNSKNIEIDISEFSDGVYFVNIITNDKRFIKKIIKK